MTQSKHTVKTVHPQAKSVIMSQNSVKTIKNSNKLNWKDSQKELLRRTESVLSMYRSKCSKLEQEKDALKKELLLTKNRLSRIEGSLQRPRKTIRPSK